MDNQESSDRLLAEALPEAVIVLQHNNKIDWCNRAAAELFGKETAEMQKLEISQLLACSALDELLADQGEDPIEMVSPLNSQDRLSLRVRPYIQKRKLLIINNITHTIHLEAMRQDFVANVSHELRTPLTVFHGYLDLLISSPDVSIEKLQDILQQMAGQAERMERLVEDLLLLAKLESVGPDLSKHELINVSVLLKEIIAEARMLSQGQHEFILEVENELILNGNVDEIHSAFSNLIFNAVRYTPAKGIIRVTGLKREGSLMLQVEDSGIGIAAKHISRITQRFYRVDKSRLYRGQGGTGLGLAIVKHVALRHNAELMIESQLGRGSVFRLLFLLDR